jgi:ZIP family zinc transporter
MNPSWDTVALAGLLTAAVTGLGALPLVIWRDTWDRVQFMCLALATVLLSVMTAGLIYEAILLGPVSAVLGIIFGIILVEGLHRMGEGMKTKKATGFRVGMILLVMSLHSIAEGIGVGVSYAGKEDFGLYVTSAIALHNIPEGMAICLVLVPEGIRVLKAALLSIITSLPQPLFALPAFFFVQEFEPLLPLGLGFAAGAMLWMVIQDLIPECVELLEKKNLEGQGL